MRDAGKMWARFMVETIIEQMFLKKKIKLRYLLISSRKRQSVCDIFIGWTNGSGLQHVGQRIYVICLFIRNLLILSAFDYIFLHIESICDTIGDYTQSYSYNALVS